MRSIVGPSVDGRECSSHEACAKGNGSIRHDLDGVEIDGVEMTGFEPATPWLQTRCSTTELHPHGQV